MLFQGRTSNEVLDVGGGWRTIGGGLRVERRTTRAANTGADMHPTIRKDTWIVYLKRKHKEKPDLD